MVNPAIVEGGFSDPVFQAQSVFHHLMDAMARPGSIRSPVADLRPPPPLGPIPAAIACTLLDPDMPVWLDRSFAGNDDITAWLGFQTGAPVTAKPVEAHFVLAGDPSVLPNLQSFALGSQDYPDRSTTLILQVDTLQDGEALTLAGPGIETSASLAPAPLPRQFVEQWAANNALYPRGIDIVFATSDALACLPRTTRLGLQEV